MNVVQYQSHNVEGSSGLLGKESSLFVSIPFGQLSSSQIYALAFAAEKYLKKQYIEVSPHLNVSFGDNSRNHRKELFDYFIQYGLLVVEADVTITHEFSADEMDKDDKIIVVNIPGAELSIKQLQGLAAFMQSEDIADIHLVNEKEFLFKFQATGDLDMLRLEIDKMGFILRSVL